MNGFSAADMSTAAANGHSEGYQAGYADAVKAMDEDSTSAAPVDPLRLGAAMTAFDAAGGHAVRYAPYWMRKALEAASTPAAPGIDEAKLRAALKRAKLPNKERLYFFKESEIDGLVRELCTDASPKGGSEHFQDRLADIEGRPRPEPEVDEVEEVVACLGDDAAAMLDENPEDERALNMQRAAELLTAMQATSAEVGA